MTRHICKKQSTASAETQETVETSASSGICSNCRRILEQAPIQNDHGNIPSKGAEFGIDAQTLRCNKLHLHCYICAAIFDEIQRYVSTDEASINEVPNDMLVDTEYLLHSGPAADVLKAHNDQNIVKEHDAVDNQEAMDVQGATLELRVTGTFQTTIADRPRDVGNADSREAVESYFHLISTHDTASQESISFIRTQFDECRQNHEYCNRKNKKKEWRPRRLIAVNTGVEGRVRLSQDTNDHHFHEEYVTLSHCWGKKSFQTLNAGNLKAFEEGINISDLPQNFRDAIRITRELSFPYIWIDSLCIMQDENGHDWRREASTMHDVYAHSALNIAATSAPDSNSGLFSVRSPAEINPPIIHLKRFRLRNYPWRVVDNAMWRKEVDDAPLTQRGWVLQERLLSRRVIHFGRQQVLWECRLKDTMEVLTQGLLPGRNAMKSRVKELDLEKFVMFSFEPGKQPEKHLWLAVLWAHLIERYSNALLTYPRDKLVALSGIAAKMAEDSGSRYVAGLWQDGIEHLLIWQTAHIPSGGRSLMAPSWSWASVNGPICQPNSWKSDALVAKVTNVKVLTEEDSPYGMVYGGFLRIQGTLCEVSLAKEEKYRFSFSHTWIVAVEGRNIESTTLQGDLEGAKSPEVQLDRASSSLADVERFFCLPIYHDKTIHELRGLILVKNPERGEFERVGSFWMWDEIKIARLLEPKPLPSASNLTPRDPMRTDSSILII
ncbi:MAG: hypothetical protein Q9160_005398 [Pyrenula sp. 1 TL-2023]